jgi:hypothetical protein
MGVIKQGILGGFQNKVGPVIGSSWKGIATMRAMPISVANPRTAPQVSNRNRFSFASKQGSRILSTIIKPLWDRFAQGQSGFNDWVKTNIEFMNANQIAQPSEIIMSRGVITGGAIIDVVGRAATGQVEIEISNITTGDSLPTDQAYVAVYTAGGNQLWGWANIGARSTMGSVKTLQTAPNAFLNGETLYAWIMFRRADGSKVSDSTYGEGIVTI